MTHKHEPPEGTTYPTNNLVAYFDDYAEAQQAAADLQSAGFAPGDIVVFHGQEALTEVQSKETPITRLRNVWEHLTQDVSAGEGRDVFLQELRQGHTALMVYAPHDDQSERARAILARHHAKVIFRLQRWYAERLPDS